LDFASSNLESTMTYALIEEVSHEDGNNHIESNLQAWKGVNNKPFVDFI